VLVQAGAGPARGRQEDLSIYDVAPTLQSLLGLPVLSGQRGRLLA
jgi:predicted AlkP superfamily phosphohydrolase/phosphomutase